MEISPPLMEMSLVSFLSNKLAIFSRVLRFSNKRDLKEMERKE